MTVDAFPSSGIGTSSYDRSTTTDSSGKYLIDTNLPTGSYNVSIEQPDKYVPMTVTESTTAGVETKNVNFALVTSGIISGTITAPDGTPLNATVYANSISGTYSGSASAR